MPVREWVGGKSVVERWSRGGTKKEEKEEEKEKDDREARKGRGTGAACA